MQQHLSSDKRNVIARIYEQYHVTVLHYFLSYTHDLMWAEDLEHDLFLKLMSLDLIVEEKAQSLVIVMARNMVIDDERRKASVMRNLRQGQLQPELTVKAEAVDHLEYDDVQCIENQALAQMSPTRAKIYRLRLHDGLSTKEIAKTLGMNLRTVEGHVYLSTKAVRSRLAKVADL